MKHSYLTHRNAVRKHRSNGFTLVELLVVMFIIASLAAISFGVFFKIRNSAKEKETTLLLKNVSTNMEAVKAETGTPYPTDSSGLVGYLTGDYAYLNSEFEVKPAMPDLLPGNAGVKFVQSGKLVDSWKRELEYVNPGVKNDFEDGFDLKSKGADPDKTEDDIEL